MTTALYRISSGEVLKISLSDQPFSDRDQTIFGVLTTPSTPDGVLLREEFPDGSLGPRRQLGFAKQADVPGNIVRNATQAEIDTYEAAAEADEGIQSARRARLLGGMDQVWRRLVKALIRGIIEENNVQAQVYNNLRAQMLAATSLADLKNRIQTNTTDMPIRTFQQAVDKLQTDIKDDD